MDEQPIYEINGNMGKTLRVYDTYCTISITSGGKAFAFGGLAGAMNGDKKFYYQDLTAVQFKNLGMTTGYLQFEYPGARSLNAMTSENSFTFSATVGTKKHRDLKEQMPGIADFIDKKVEECKRNGSASPVAPVSGADEIKKYKDLLDQGIISQDEFEAKKKQLLGL